MARGNERKSERDGGRAEPSSSERVVDRRLDLPRSFRDKSIHDVWGPNGPAALLRRLAQEHELGRLAPRQLTKDELAQLVELYEDEPLPKALRNLVVLELRNQRPARPGRKTGLNSIQRLEQDLLPSVYRRAMRAAAWLRKRLIRREERKMRWQTNEPVPSQTELAMSFVRNRLPSTRDLDDKTIANRLSAIKDPSEKKPRAKAAKR